MLSLLNDDLYMTIIMKFLNARYEI